MQDCVNHILKETDSIDVLINSAGFGSHGAIEDVSLVRGRQISNGSKRVWY